MATYSITLQKLCGLPINTYFSAVKLKWLIDNCEAVKKAVEEERCLFGTVDSWLIWVRKTEMIMSIFFNCLCYEPFTAGCKVFFVLQNMTGGTKGGLHITDITNASRTMFLNLETQAWDPYLCK